MTSIYTGASMSLDGYISGPNELARDKIVGVNAGTIASQCLDAGLLDEVWIDLVPVVLGGGTSFFAGLGRAAVELEGPVWIAEGTDVTHLRYRVRKA